MTIFGVARGRVENGNILGFKQTAEQVLGCRKVEPGEYHLAHGFVEMNVNVGPNDSVSVETASIMSARSIKDIRFGGSTLGLPLLQGLNDSLNVIPKMGEAALTVGPDIDGISFSLERHSSELVAPVAIGMLRIKNALKPRLKGRKIISFA